MSWVKAVYQWVGHKFGLMDEVGKCSHPEDQRYWLDADDAGVIDWCSQCGCFMSDTSYFGSGLKGQWINLKTDIDKPTHSCCGKGSYQKHCRECQEESNKWLDEHYPEYCKPFEIKLPPPELK